MRQMIGKIRNWINANMNDRERDGRTRSRDLRIRDENNGIAKNVKAETVVEPRGHRSLSRVGGFYKRDSSELLHTLIGHNDTSRTERTKNIPMTNERPLIKRWNSIQYLSNDKDRINKETNGISPLTVLKDQYDTKRPVSNYATPSANSYHNPQPKNIPYSHRSDDEYDDRTTTTTPMQVGNKIYTKITKILGNSKESSLHKYQSESDSEDEGIVSPRPEPTEEDNIQVDISENVAMDFDEINEFQNNFIKKFHDPQDSTSRVQQKILDYRDLQEETPKTYFNITSNTYNSRIQHETLMQQYNLIRLRFSSTPQFKDYVFRGRPIQETTTDLLKSNMGVSGFINRMELVGKYGDFPLGDKGEFKEDVDEYLKTMWNQELETISTSNTQVQTPSSTTFTPTTPTLTPNTPGHTPTYTTPTYHYNQFTLSNKSSFDVTHTASFSDLAGRVKLN